MSKKKYNLLVKQYRLMGLLSTLFGKRRKKTKKSKSKRPPAALRKLCKKLKVRLTLKRGHRRVYKSVKELKKQCLSKLKARKSSFGRKSRRAPRRVRFGLSPASVSDRKIISAGAPQYSSQVQRGNKIFGVGKPFFDTAVPQAMPPSWYKNKQPDGGFVFVGAPFGAYKNPLKKYV